MKSPKRKTDSQQSSTMQDIEFIAKTIHLPNNQTAKGVDVYTHCKVVGLVAKELIKRMPVWLQKKHFAKGSEFIAALHDIGKISPGFQKKIYQNISANQAAALQCFNSIPNDLDKLVNFHFTVSKIALDSVIPADVIGRDFICEIAGRHHGISKSSSGFANDSQYGGGLWQEARKKVVYQLKEYFNLDWSDISVTSDFQADVIAGLTTVSDWIGSGVDFENSNIKDMTDSALSALVSDALDRAGFVCPAIRKGLSFGDIFKEISSPYTPYLPHPLQQQMINAVTDHGVYVLEAPMGLGKTEAALFAAYKMLEQNLATGIYFALPTQLTSNKMVERMNNFLENILAKNSPHTKSLLLHGAAWLTQTDMGEEGEPGRSWFDYRKRGLLAPFAVGTIDQALMAVMNVKHGFVRTFGLAGKVVILDEVHCYDAYTGTIIDYLVKGLKEIGCTVIILSATLSINRRAALLGTYNIGISNIADNILIYNDSIKEQSKSEQFGYPLISALYSEKSHIENSLQQEDSKTPITFYFTAPAVEEPEILISVCHQDETALEEALIRSENGQQVLWIENSVAEAQELFKIIGARASEIGVECGLIHSRFTRSDRELNENRWVEIYGKNGRKNRNAGIRHKDKSSKTEIDKELFKESNHELIIKKSGYILVGTQVLEQSLDIDADFLISRIAPTDMILQRIGRLWRHRKNDNLRPKQAEREVWILSPPIEDVISNPDKIGQSRWVYAPYVLFRSLEVWLNEVCKNNGKIKLTGRKIREFIESTYLERTEEGVMSKYKNEIDKNREKLGGLARVGLSKGGVTLPESKASTRYSERESVDVLLIRKKRHSEDGIYLTLYDGSTLLLPNDIHLNRRGTKTWRKISAALHKNTLSVNENTAPDYFGNEMKFLSQFVYLGNGKDDMYGYERPFRAAIVKDSGTLAGLGQREASEEYHLQYDSVLGYVAEKKY